ncbi:MAG: pyridoxamine 5'-phosphate oxidase family protein [Actinomycetales bacterium]|jgi:hypothetical protein|nr:pyridoxamine 5'-phosphate oxidase family protein [Actinomycetales bacterium]
MDSFDIRSGPWSADQIDAHLRSATIPIRLASSGTYPLVQSLWFTFDGTALWCATPRDSVLSKRLVRANGIGFEIAADTPPYLGVRGTGRAQLLPLDAAAVLVQLIDKYLGDRTVPLAKWLLSRLDEEVAIRIDSLTVTSWDYSSRM